MMKTTCSWRAEKIFPRPSLPLLRRLAENASELAGSRISGVLSLNFAGETEMAELNAAFVGHEGPTDVICFDYRESKSELPGEDGEEDRVDVEIIVCPAVALREARKRSLPYSRELTLYLVHGLLHAAGEDDLKPELKRKMRRREHKTMNELDALFPVDALFPEPVPMEINKK